MNIDEILESNAISALKIEGRTKSPYYAAISTRTYRMAIDDFYNGESRKDIYQYELNTLKNRGFTDGYIINRPYEKNNTQNHKTAISDGSYQVNALIRDDGEFAICKYTIKTGESKEIITPLNAKIDDSILVDNEIGKIYKENGAFFIIFKKILLEDNKELSEIHSGNINYFKLPCKLPSYSFLRERID